MKLKLNHQENYKESGFASLYFLLLIKIITVLFLINIVDSKKIFFKAKKEIKQNLCLKEYNSILQSYVVKINDLNSKIKYFHISYISLSLTPATFQLAQFAKHSRNLLKLKQSYVLINNYQFNLANHLKKCHRYTSMPYNPYLLKNNFLFKRNNFHQTILKKKNWERIFLGPSLFKVNYHIKHNEDNNFKKRISRKW